MTAISCLANSGPALSAGSTESPAMQPQQQDGNGLVTPVGAAQPRLSTPGSALSPVEQVYVNS